VVAYVSIDHISIGTTIEFIIAVLAVDVITSGVAFDGGEYD
jgi:hypothetical protein